MPTLPKPSKRREKAKQFTQVANPFYNSAKWRKLRKAYIRANPMCEHPQCNKAGEVVDHITPIRLGGAALKWDNLQTLCAMHHNRKSGSEAKYYTNMKQEGEQR